MKHWGIGLLMVFTAVQAWGHARLMTPVPRTTNSGIKTGPCGPTAPSANPVQLTGGTTMTVTWQETINHPGKYIFTWLQPNETAMPGQTPVMIPDNQDNGNLPHNYTTTITVPNVNCAGCVLQMIQSMEENPAAPTFYYSCADVNIVASSGPPTGTPPTTVTPPLPNDFGSQSTQYSGEKSVVGSCGSIVGGGNSKGGGLGGTAALALILPLLTFFVLRRRIIASSH